MRNLLVLVAAGLAFCSCGTQPPEACPKPSLGAWRVVNVCQSDATMALCQVGQSKFESGCSIDGFECVTRCPD